jgi:hypothetical protein
MPKIIWSSKTLLPYQVLVPNLSLPLDENLFIVYQKIKNCSTRLANCSDKCCKKDMNFLLLAKFVIMFQNFKSKLEVPSIGDNLAMNNTLGTLKQ